VILLGVTGYQFFTTMFFLFVVGFIGLFLWNSHRMKPRDYAVAGRILVTLGVIASITLAMVVGFEGADGKKRDEPPGFPKRPATGSHIDTTPRANRLKSQPHTPNETMPAHNLDRMGTDEPRRSTFRPADQWWEESE
jgi:hypothetical protein